MLATIQDGTIQVVAACTSALLIMGLGLVSRYLRKLNDTVAQVPAMAKKLDMIEKQTNGEMAKKFSQVQEAISNLKGDLHEMNVLRNRIAILENSIGIVRLSVEELKKSPPSS